MADDILNPTDTGHINQGNQVKAIVVDVNDPDKCGRVRCMIVGLQENVPKEMLPWIHVQQVNQPSIKGVGFSPHNYYPGATVNLQAVGQQGWEIASSVMNAQTDITTQDVSETIKGNDNPTKPVVRGEQNYEQHNRLREFAESAATITGIVNDLKNSNNAVNWETTPKENAYKGPIDNAETPTHYNRRKVSRSKDKKTIGVEQFKGEYKNAQKFILGKIGETGSLLNGALSMIDNLYNVKNPLSTPLPTTQIGLSNLLSALKSIIALFKKNKKEIENLDTNDANTANAINTYSNYVELSTSEYVVVPPTSNIMANAVFSNVVYTFNTRTGDITLTSNDVIQALGYVPSSNGGGNTTIVANTGIVSNAFGLFVNAAYINTISSNLAYYVVANTGIISNSSGVFIDPSYASSITSNTANLAYYVIANNGIVSNSTGVFVNTAYIATLSANNASYLGTIAAANYQANLGLIANSTGTHVLANTGIIANSTGTFVNSAYIATISANNASFLGGTAAASYVINTDSRTLSGNINFTGANVTFSANVRFSSGLLANGAMGTNGQVLTSNGTVVYWSTAAGGGGTANFNDQTTDGATTYPIGTVLFVKCGASGANRNSSQLVKLGTGTGSGGYSFELGSGGTQLTGTWRFCGYNSEQDGGVYTYGLCVMQRVA